jgi:hypothetical protein
MIKEEEIKPR